MSLDKAIEHGKEKRKPYRGAKAIFPGCRNHGNCKWCELGRTHKSRRVDESGRQQLKEYDEEQQ